MFAGAGVPVRPVILSQALSARSCAFAYKLGYLLRGLGIVANQFPEFYLVVFVHSSFIPVNRPPLYLPREDGGEDLLRRLPSGLRRPEVRDDDLRELDLDLYDAPHDGDPGHRQEVLASDRSGAFHVLIPRWIRRCSL